MLMQADQDNVFPKPLYAQRNNKPTFPQSTHENGSCLSASWMMEWVSSRFWLSNSLPHFKQQKFLPSMWLCMWLRSRWAAWNWRPHTWHGKMQHHTIFELTHWHSVAKDKKTFLEFVMWSRPSLNCYSLMIYLLYYYQTVNTRKQANTYPSESVMKIATLT